MMPNPFHPEYPKWVRQIFNPGLKCSRCRERFTIDDLVGLGVSRPHQNAMFNRGPRGRAFADCSHCGKSHAFDVETSRGDLLDAVADMFDHLLITEDDDEDAGQPASPECPCTHGPPDGDDPSEVGEDDGGEIPPGGIQADLEVWTMEEVDRAKDDAANDPSLWPSLKDEHLTAPRRRTISISDRSTALNPPTLEKLVQRRVDCGNLRCSSMSPPVCGTAGTLWIGAVERQPDRRSWCDTSTDEGVSGTWQKIFSDPKKDCAHDRRNKVSRRRQPVVAVRQRAASPEEAAAVDRAINRLLTEWVRQVRASAPGTSGGEGRK